MSDHEFPRLQAIPRPEKASLLIDGRERVEYEFASRHARPFFYPLIGPSGATLTRMGHPNPVGHEHHKSVWFGHQNVAGVNFWEEKTSGDVKVRHKRITHYQDGADLCGFVAELDWWAGGVSLLNHRLLVAIEPRPDGGFALDLQSRFEATKSPIELGKTNFGFLGVRVAKTISEQFGGGRLVNAEGASGEPAIFAKPSRWVDYSGPVAPNVTEGICYMDHPSNPRHPSHWHVRRDGWMSAAFNLSQAWGIAKDHPLDLRYRLLIHSGPAAPSLLNREFDRFSNAPPLGLKPANGRALASLSRENSP